MKLRWNHITGLILLMAVASLQAQIISVQSRLSSDSMMIGDQLLFTLHVEAAEHIPFTLPELKDTLSRDLEVLFPYATDTSRADGSLVVDHPYVITGFEPGMQLVPAQPVVYSYNNTTDTALSMPLIIRVYEPAVDTTHQIKPIKPPMNTPVSLKEVVPWIALATIIIAGATIAVRRRLIQG